MKFRTIFRHFRESLKSLTRNGWMTFASVSAVTVTLILVGIFSVIMMNLNKFANDIENDVEIKVLIDIIKDPQQAEIAEDKLLNEIKKIPGVQEVKYSSKEEELDALVESYGDELDLFEQSNPLRNVIYVKAKNPQETVKVAKKIEKLDNTYDVIYGEGKVDKLFNVLNTGRNIGLVLIIGLLFTAIFLIANTIRIAIFARGDEIEIMRLVGASNAFVRIPFVLEGMWIGVLGSIIPITLISVSYYKIYNFLSEKNRRFSIKTFRYYTFNLSSRWDNIINRCSYRYLGKLYIRTKIFKNIVSWL